MKVAIGVTVPNGVAVRVAVVVAVEPVPTTVLTVVLEVNVSPVKSQAAIIANVVNMRRISFIGSIK